MLGIIWIRRMLRFLTSLSRLLWFRFERQLQVLVQFDLVHSCLYFKFTRSELCWLPLDYFSKRLFRMLDSFHLLEFLVWILTKFLFLSSVIQTCLHQFNYHHSIKMLYVLIKLEVKLFITFHFFLDWFKWLAINPSYLFFFKGLKD